MFLLRRMTARPHEGNQTVSKTNFGIQALPSLSPKAYRVRSEVDNHSVTSEDKFEGTVARVTTRKGNLILSVL
jgi:hypothetical protein